VSPRGGGISALRRTDADARSAPPLLLTLTLAEWAVLGLLGGGTLHGFGLVKATAPHGEVGRVWSVPTPVVYRAINHLRDKGLIEPVGEERSDAGPPRTLLDITPEGRQQLLLWLRTPVEHMREVRGPLLVKLAITAHLHLRPDELLTAQIASFTPLLDGLERRAAEPGADFEHTLASWRLESARGVMRFLARAAEAGPR
jgi:DNA-binding PadR family transcriptional regulator